jgi:hypothetical protein
MHHCIENPTVPQASKALETLNTAEPHRQCAFLSEYRKGDLTDEEAAVTLRPIKQLYRKPATGKGARIYAPQAISFPLEPRGSVLLDQHMMVCAITPEGLKALD